jgi:hypothetical protein
MRKEYFARALVISALIVVSVIVFVATEWHMYSLHRERMDGVLRVWNLRLQEAERGVAEVVSTTCPLFYESNEDNRFFYNVIYGTPGNDSTHGTLDNDVIFGFEGDDEISGLDGDDILCGGAGNNVLNGGRGADALIGGSDCEDLLASLATEPDILWRVSRYQ